MKDISRNVTLICNICGNDQFETLDTKYEDMRKAPGNTRFKCSDCGRIITKSELLEENKEIINANIEDVKKETITEIEKELKKALKKFRR